MTAIVTPPTLYSPTRRTLGVFTSASAMLASIDALRSRGYHKLETFTPFDLPELDDRLGLRRSRIGWFVAGGGLAGMVVAYSIQWWANVHEYPLNSGGRPVHAVPAFLLSTFEGTVICAALAAFFGLLLLLRLPKLWAPIDEIDGFDRASVDQFWIAVGEISTSSDSEEVEQILLGSGAIHTVGPANV